jgi:hypothetical protein
MLCQLGRARRMAGQARGFSGPPEQIACWYLRTLGRIGQLEPDRSPALAPRHVRQDRERPLEETMCLGPRERGFRSTSSFEHRGDRTVDIAGFEPMDRELECSCHRGLFGPQRQQRENTPHLRVKASPFERG